MGMDLIHDYIYSPSMAPTDGYTLTEDELDPVAWQRFRELAEPMEHLQINWDATFAAQGWDRDDFFLFGRDDTRTCQVFLFVRRDEDASASDVVRLRLRKKVRHPGKVDDIVVVRVSEPTLIAKVVATQREGVTDRIWDLIGVDENRFFFDEPSVRKAYRACRRTFKESFQHDFLDKWQPGRSMFTISY